MVSLYKCKIIIDTGIRYDTAYSVVFTDDVEKIPNLIDKEFVKHSDESIEHISIEKIDPKEGLVIKFK